MPTITRKIKLSFNPTETDPEKKKVELDEYYKTIFSWQYIVSKAANIIASHCFLQEQIKEMFYLTDEIKLKLADVRKDENGILTTSKQNSTYQVLSSKYKGEIPSAILTALNSQIVQTFNKEKKDYFTGKRSLRNYKRDIPIPFQYANVINLHKCDEHGNYSFSLYGLPFKTYFGRDMSGNKIILDGAMEGKYKFCDSSIQIDEGKMYLLAVFQFEKSLIDIDKEKVCEAHLSIDTPVILSIGRKNISIGDKEEFLHRRQSIQASLRRAQIAARFNKNGKGRTKKMANTVHFEKLEHDYIQTRIHMYTHRIVEHCINNKCGTIILKNQVEKEEKAKEDEFLLRNWSYYDMKQKITYKAAKVGIEVITE